jgi:LPXTG-motif cell wall-anchored protein
LGERCVRNAEVDSSILFRSTPKARDIAGFFYMTSAMKLTTVHQFLIASFMGLGLVYAARSLWLLSRTGDAQHGLFAAVGLAVAVAVGLYLRKFRRKQLER